MKAVLIKSSMLTLTLGTALVLSACGGGGGGSSTSTSVSAAATPVAVTTENAPQITADAFEGGNTVSAYGESASNTNNVLGVQISSDSSLLDNSLELLYQHSSIPHTAIATGITESRTGNCSKGGTATYTASYSDANNVTAGDSLLISTSNCVTSSGTTLNGSLKITFNTNTAGTFSTSSAWKAGMTLQFTNLSRTVNTITSKFNGDLTVSVDQHAYQDLSIVVTNNSLNHFKSKSGATTKDLTLSNVNMTGTLINGNYDRNYTYTLAGTSTKLGAVNYTLTTLENMKGISGNYPSSGKVKIVSASKGTLYVTALDSSRVQLDVDADNDGNIDTNGTKVITWADLTNLIQ